MKHFLPFLLSGTWAAASIGLIGCAPSSAAPVSERALPEISANPNLRPAGVLKDGVLKLTLEVKEGLWFPDNQEAPGIPVWTFSEPGQPPQIPGPMIRVPAGTTIQVTLKNRVGSKLIVHGLHSRPGNSADTLEIDPEATQKISFKTGDPGTYYYWATTPEASKGKRRGKESQLSGALIVDPPSGAAVLDDRVFVIGAYIDPPHAAQRSEVKREIFVINGKSWPHTERFHYFLGDTVRWRWINSSSSLHPMHLHGFYFKVDSVGDGETDTIYTPPNRRQAVTELMRPGHTMSMTWSPDRIGNWLLHCHIVSHVTPDEFLKSRRSHAQEGPHDPSRHALESMAGLVLGLSVDSREGASASPPSQPAKTRNLRLIVKAKPAHFGDQPGLGYVLQENGISTPPQGVAVSGPPILLTRGQPVSISVENQLAFDTTVHWHGMELESYYDGVAGWSGYKSKVAPHIPPGGKFIVEFTPPRAGTFIYHTHMDDEFQMGSGLVGPLVVLEPGETFDGTRDRILLLSRAGPGPRGVPMMLNGSTQPEPMLLKVGEKYRFRIINITPNSHLTVQLLGEDSQPVSWSLISKDGAGLPKNQIATAPARLLISAGETYDFLFSPSSARALKFQVNRPGNLSDSPALLEVPVRVR